MKRFTLGFVFTTDLDQVLLIHKTHPEWQAGKVNGLGGKIEESEDSQSCIVREIKEEAGLVTEKNQWTFIGRMHGPTWNVDVLACVYTGKTDDAHTQETEPVEWFDVDTLPNNIIGNLTWLIPITLDKLKNKEIKTFDVECE